MTAATSPRCSATSTDLMSFGGQMTIWSSVAPGMPADIGTSYGGVTPAPPPPCQPWEGAREFRDFLPPGGGRPPPLPGGGGPRPPNRQARRPPPPTQPRSNSG